MSINYCTISSTEIDGFCGTQRVKVLARLIEQKYAVVNSPPSSGGWAYGPSFNANHGIQQPQYIPPFRQELDQDPQPYEQPWITVTASEIFNTRGSETLETTPRLDFVTVTNVEFNNEPDITVNITDIEIKHA